MTKRCVQLKIMWRTYENWKYTFNWEDYFFTAYFSDVREKTVNLQMALLKDECKYV